MFYYYGYDDRWYGPEVRTGIHTAKNLRLALKNARAMSKDYAVVKIQSKKTYSPSDCEYIVFRMADNERIVYCKKKSTRTVKVLKSDGTIQG